MDLNINQDFQKRLENIIPGGAHTYSRGKDQFSSNTPAILNKGKGCIVWDVTGNKFIDYGMALRAVSIGYSEKSINKYVAKQIKKGNVLTRPSILELEAAEKFVNYIPHIDMVKFVKTGSSANTAAIKLARAYTNKKYICVPNQQPFFSFDDWFIGTTTMNKGALKETSDLTLKFNYGDLNSLKNHFEKYPNDIAAVLLEPSTYLTPCSLQCNKKYESTLTCFSCTYKKDNFLQQIRELCDKYKTVLIFDEIITGFRWHKYGASYYFNVKPDLVTFGKAMANGFPLAAVSGKREIMDIASTNIPGKERVFLLSSTHGGEMASLAALIKTIDFYEKNEVTDHLWNYGNKLKDGFQKLIESNNLSEIFNLVGPGVCLHYYFNTGDEIRNLKLKTIFMQKMIEHNIIMPWISISFSHRSKHLEKTLNALEDTLFYLKKIRNDDLDKYLLGDYVKPVFRPYN